MDKLKKQIEDAGLRKDWISEKVGVSAAHLSMMLNKKANMPEEIRKKINSIINQAMKITV